MSDEWRVVPRDEWHWDPGPDCKPRGADARRQGQVVRVSSGDASATGPLAMPNTVMLTEKSITKGPKCLRV
jgi:hypothetical protein